MSTPNRYQAGFRLLNSIVKKRTYGVTAAVAISRGDVIKTVIGYASLGTTLAQVTPIVVGIANTENTAAAAVSSGLINVEVIPFDFNYDFMVPVETDAVLDQADVGIIYDINSEDGLTNAAALTAGKGFFVDAVDISTAALANSSTFGFAKGHFEDIFAS